MAPLPAALLKRINDGENAVRVVRQFRLMTQRELGERSGIRPNHISAIERGMSYGLKSARRLAEALGQDNADVPDEVFHEILPVLRQAGIRAGEPWHLLRSQLTDQVHKAEDLQGVTRPAASTRQRLYLGYLWD